MFTKVIPDVFVLSEHGFDRDSSKYLNFEHYNQANIYCRTYFEFGGVVIFPKKLLKFETFPIMLCEDKHFEASGIKLYHGNS